MARQVEEIEWKFDVVPDLEVPDLTGAAGVASVSTLPETTLRATYYDTEDLDLIRAGITLRRRTGGADDGWHLKPPEGQRRREVHEPLGDSDEVPRALRELPVVATRGRPLRAIAELTTRRAEHALIGEDGRVLAQMTDDRVEGTTVPTARVGLRSIGWREWEVELVDGDPEFLPAAADMLRAAGASVSTSGSKLARVLAVNVPAHPLSEHPPATKGDAASRLAQHHLDEQIVELRMRDPLTRLDAPDAVHKMRVAVRRLRSALATYRPMLDREMTEPLREELKWLGGVLGHARDEQVLHARYEVRIQDGSSADITRAARLMAAHLDGEHRSARQAVTEALRSDRYVSLQEALDNLTDQAPWTDAANRPVDEVLPKQLRHEWRRVTDGVDAVGEAQGPDQRAALLHETRKAGKRFRYAVEPLRPHYGKPAKRLVKRLNKLQSRLGDHQDSVMSRHAVRRTAEDSAPLDAFALGVLHRREEDAAGQAEVEAMTAWTRVSKQAYHAWYAS